MSSIQNISAASWSSGRVQDPGSGSKSSPEFNTLPMRLLVVPLSTSRCIASLDLARARPAVPLGLWSITSLLCGNFYVPRLHKFIKWFADNDFPHRNLTCTELFVIS